MDNKFNSMELTLDDAQKLVGAREATDLILLSKEYSYKIWAAVENQEYTSDYKKALAAAYRRIAESICELQIANDGGFKPIVDFSGLDDVQVFTNPKNPETKILGVSPCSACSGLGELIKFNKKPKEVECLKCKTVSYILDNENIVVNQDIVLVNGEDKTKDPKYKRLLGMRIEDCESCDGTGRYITEPEPDLRINVQCKTCRGMKYHKESKKTQILIKCKTCRGNRLVTIPVLAPSVQSTTLCRPCSGMGFVPPKPGPNNPVLTKDLASKIKNM